MTLCTHFRTDAIMDPLRLHEFATACVNPHPEREVIRREETGAIYNGIAQGLYALIDTKFSTAGLLQVEGRDFPWEDYEEDPEFPFEPAPPAIIDVSMDTSYGFDLNGMGCTQLHAGVLRALNAFVLNLHPNAHNHWYNEFAGTWHTFEDSEGWQKFAGDGAAANNWFEDFVRPVISSLTQEKA